MGEDLYEIFKGAVLNGKGTYQWLVPAYHLTDLEKILSNLVHTPVKLIDYKSSISASGSSPEAYDFQFTAVPAKVNCVEDDEIPFCDKCCNGCEYEEGFEIEAEFEPTMWGIPDVDRIIFNPPATVVFWADGTKTVVKCMEGQPFEKYAGFCAACMKKMFGSTSRAKAIMEECDQDNWMPVVEPKPISNPKKSAPNPKTIEVSELIKAFVDGIKQAVEAKEKKDETPAE